MNYDYSDMTNEYLFEKAKNGCNQSKDELFERNIPMVQMLAKRWKRNGSTEALEDLYSMGYLGLTKAYCTYDITKGYKFTTYLGRVVWQEYTTMVRTASMKCRSKYTLMSIDSHFGEEDDTNTYHEIAFEYESTNQEYINVENAIYNKMLLDIINKSHFNEKERVVAEEYFVNNLSLTEIGAKIGVSRQAVHQAFNRGLNKLKGQKKLFA